MSEPQFIPFLPDSAPFTAEQRAYLNGFLAGMFSRVPAAAGQLASASMPAPMEPLTILVGSQTGTADKLAKRLAKEAGRRGFAPTVHELGQYAVTQLASERHVLVITSTYGDGEPPDNARTFWETLSAEAAPKLSGTRFSVCALGDSNYPKFCAFGKAVDERLEKLGGVRVVPRADCDLDLEEPFQKWLGAALGSIAAAPAGVPSRADLDVDVPAPGADPADSEGPRYHRNHPFPAALLVNRRLNADGSAKDTRHFAFSLEGSGLGYEAGDALGVYPTNCPALVRELLGVLGTSGEETVPGVKGGDVSLREALTSHYDITRINPPLLKALAERTGDEQLKLLSAPGVNGELTRFLRGREVIDLLLAHPSARFTPAELVALLKKLQPRLYSIASSPKAHLGEVHLCVGIVRYASLGRERKGVCSTFLADRVTPPTPVPVFLHHNPNFRPPVRPEAPMIMVGPGTGIAPFRGFLHERRARGDSGRNWLFFGDQRASTDYLYREEIEQLHHDGLLSRVDTAFSRDQEEKVYVQNRMIERARDLYAWLEDGAHFYVCGDASRMARDVDVALHEVVSMASGATADQAAEYVKRLKAEKRYQRDVY